MLRRRSLVEKLLQKLDAPPARDHGVTDQLTEDVFHDFLALIDPLFAGLQELNEPDGTGEVLSRLIDDFIALRARIEHTQHLRPHIALARSAMSASKHIEQVLREYLAALQAATPIDAKRHADRAQSHLDDAGTAAQELGERRRSLDRIDAGSSGAMLHSMLGARMERTGETPMGMIENAEERVARLLGVEPKTGYELPFLLAEDVAAVELDVVRFVDTYVSAFHLLDDHREELIALTQSAPLVINDLVDAQVSGFDMCWHAFHLLRNAQTRRQGAEALLNLQADVVEGPGAFIIRVLLLVAGLKTRPYIKLKGDNATEQLRTARREERLADLLSGLDDHLRTAKSHHMVQYTEHSVIATTGAGGAIEYEHDRLIDVVLEGIESVMACLLALREAMGQADIRVDDENLPEQIGISIVELAEITLSWMTGIATQVTVVGDEITIQLVGSTDWKLSSLVVALGPALRRVERFRVVQTHQGVTRELVGDTASLRNRTKMDDDFEGQLQLIRLCLGWRLNDGPAIAPDALRAWSAAKAIDALHGLVLGDTTQETRIESSRQLRSLVHLAQEADDSPLEKAMRDALRWARTGTADLSALKRLESYRFGCVEWDLP